jgi:hypothetical protein
LEKGNLWFQENLEEITEARKTQSFFQDNTIFIEQGEKLPLSQFLIKLDDR